MDPGGLRGVNRKAHLWDKERLPALDGAQLLCAPVNWPAFPRPDGERPAEIVRVQADAAS